jgi:hypothetical protein
VSAGGGRLKDVATPDASPRPRGSSIDEIIELYKKDVDRTLLRENLKLTPDERVRKMLSVREFVEELRRSPKRPLE